jgi:hypothetical protein
MSIGFVKEVWHKLVIKLCSVKNLFVLVSTFLLVGCSSTAPPEPTIIVIPSSTQSPVTLTWPVALEITTKPAGTLLSSTKAPLTSTPILTSSSSGNLPLPSGEPLSTWNGLPIMEDAIAGEEKEGGYSYSIDTTVEQVQNFYEIELADMGWMLFATGKGETGSLLLMFRKGERTTTVNVFEQEGLTIILLIHY